MQAAVDHVNASSLSAEEKNALLARLVVPPQINFDHFLALPDSAMRALIPTAAASSGAAGAGASDLQPFVCRRLDCELGQILQILDRIQRQMDAKEQQERSKEVLTYAFTVPASVSKTELGTAFRSYLASGYLQHISQGGGYQSLSDRVDAALNGEESVGSVGGQTHHCVLVVLQGTLQTLARCQLWMKNRTILFQELYPPHQTHLTYRRMQILESDGCLHSVALGKDGCEVATASERGSDAGSAVLETVHAWAQRAGDRYPTSVQVFSAFDWVFRQTVPDAAVEVVDSLSANRQ